MDYRSGLLSDDELREKAFRRIADVLWSYWDEQKDTTPRAAYVNSRIFDVLIDRNLILLGTSTKGNGHIEHVVPCVYIRDLAFEMFWDGKSKNDVAEMIRRLLRVAYITRSEAHHMDFVLGLKTRMPEGWSSQTGSILARLEMAGIELQQTRISEHC